MPNLAQLTAIRASASVDVGAGAVVHFEYYPQRLTTSLLLKLNEATPEKLAAASPERQVEALTLPAAALATLLASWDLTETDPESGAEVALPIDAAHIDALGITLQWTLLGGIFAAQNGGKAEASAASVSAPTSDAP